jgi:hypothetical protein
MSTDDEDFLEVITGDLFDREGYAISERKWLELRKDFYENVLVARTTLPRVMINTVWLGLNQSWYPNQMPVIFETMTFRRRCRDKGALWDRQVYRWRTEGEARAGHKRLVDQVRQRGVYGVLRRW